MSIDHKDDTAPASQTAVSRQRPPRPEASGPTGALTSGEQRKAAMESAGEHPYLDEDNTFMRVIAAERIKAVRLIDDLDDDIERMQTEIDQRRARKARLELVVARADAALGIKGVIEGNEG